MKTTYSPSPTAAIRGEGHIAVSLQNFSLPQLYEKDKESNFNKLFPNMPVVVATNGFRFTLMLYEHIFPVPGEILTNISPPP